MGRIPTAWQGRSTDVPTVLLTSPVKLTMMGLTEEEQDGESHPAMVAVLNAIKLTFSVVLLGGFEMCMASPRCA